jgi:hypothetical protein
MIQFKNICLVMLMLFAGIGCTEIYIPDVSTNTQALVVEGLITNGSGPFSIKLSIASPLNSTQTENSNMVLDAKVTIKDNENKTFELNNQLNGYYSTPNTFSSKTGNSYTLHIETKDGSIYESNPQQLLPAQSYDSIRGIYTTQSYLNYSKELTKVPGADIRMDLYKKAPTTNFVPSCRFISTITLQYVYTYTENDPKTGAPITTWHWLLFGWKSFKLNTDENISEEKSVTTNSSIINHSIGFMPFGTNSYNFYTPPYPYVIYYLSVDQYTMTDDAYRFYKGANDQLAATGKIFDPITSQLYGNMKCINNPAKIVLGLFEVSSFMQHGFTVWLSNKSVLVTKVQPVVVPYNDEFQYKVWDSPSSPPDSPDFKPIPYPTWWFHN